MKGRNKISIGGHLGKDPEIRTMTNGNKVANFSLAATEAYQNKQGEKVENTEWFNVVLWSPLAELAEAYLKRGNPVLVDGKIQTRSWEDKDGNKRYTTEVVGREMTLLGSKEESTSAPVSQPSEPVSAVPEDDETDDLPF